MKKTELLMMPSEIIFRNMYGRLYYEGQEVIPRGMKSLEIENFNVDIPPYVRFTNFRSRNFNLDYVKKEFLWYLKGDKYDTSIAEHAKMWYSLINKDGSINSNYGQYIFYSDSLNGTKSQFDNVFEILKRDKFSRRAVIMILQPYHLLMETSDVCCTYSMSFRIRDNYLNMTVRMRSQDSILGFATDAPCFSFIHEMLYMKLKEVYPELKYGIYHHSVDSFHVYERHYDLLKKIIEGDLYIPVECPKIKSAAEVEFLRRVHIGTNPPTEIPDDYEFTIWLRSYY